MNNFIKLGGDKVNNFIKLDVAIDLISDEISQVNEKYNDTKEERYNLELNELLNKREEIYNGNINIINEVMNTYETRL